MRGSNWDGASQAPLCPALAVSRPGFTLSRLACAPGVQGELGVACTFLLQGLPYFLGVFFAAVKTLSGCILYWSEVGGALWD